MKIETYIVLHSDMCINTEFENTLTNFTKTDTLTKRLVLLPVDWDKIGLISTKRLHIMNKVFVIHSKNHYEQYLAFWYTSS